MAVACKAFGAAMQEKAEPREEGRNENGNENNY